MTDEQIHQIAVDAIAWAKGSWGQGKYDAPRYDNATMTAIYERIAEIASRESKRHAGLPPDKVS
jgi:hypothetical protein